MCNTLIEIIELQSKRIEILAASRALVHRRPALDGGKTVKGEAVTS
jgi:hypothetical protein